MRILIVTVRVPFVNAVFPEARFVQIVRDGRDATASIVDRWTSGPRLQYLLRKARFVPTADVPRYAWRFLRARFLQVGSRTRHLPTWGPRFQGMDALVRSDPLLRVCARQWERCVALSSDALEPMLPERWIRVRYEELALDPTSTITRILSWLGASAEASSPGAVGGAVAQVRAGRSGIWNDRVPARDMEITRDVLEPAMIRLGYTWTET